MGNKKSQIITILCIAFLLGGCNQKDTAVTTQEPASTETSAEVSSSAENADTLSNKITKLKQQSIGATLPELLFASDEKTIILDESGIIIYNQKEEKTSDVVLLKQNEVMGDITLQGEKASQVYAAKDGSKVYSCSILGENNFVYDTDTKAISKISKPQSKDEFQNFTSIPKKAMMKGKGKSWYSCDEKAVQTNAGIVYIAITPASDTLENLSLVTFSNGTIGKKKVLANTSTAAAQISEKKLTFSPDILSIKPVNIWLTDSYKLCASLKKMVNKKGKKYDVTYKSKYFDKINECKSELSGGEEQRAAIEDGEIIQDSDI